PRDEVARDDALGLAVDHHEIEHLALWMHLDQARADRAHQRRIRTEQQLLPGLSARIKRARDLRAAKRAVRQQPAILARERHALRDALINDIDRYFGEPVHIGFPRTIVSALDRVVEKPVNAVA